MPKSKNLPGKLRKPKKPEESEMPEKPEKPEKSGKSEKPEKPGKSEKPEKSKKPGKPDKTKTNQTDKTDATEAADRDLMPPSIVLSKQTFQIRVVQWTVEEGGTVKSFISSQDLEKKKLDARTITLQAFRALIPKASQFSSHNKFCDPSGMTIPDESITFEEYLAIDPEGSTASEENENAKMKPIPAVKLFFKADVEGNDPPDLSKFQADITRDEHESATAKEFVERIRKSLLTDEKNLLVKSGAGLQSGPGSLTEAQWGLVMRNCGVLYGWYFDRRTRRVIQAPKQAFRPRPQQHKVYVQTAPPKLVRDPQDQDGEGDQGGKDEDFAGRKPKGKETKGKEPKDENLKGEESEEEEPKSKEHKGKEPENEENDNEKPHKKDPKGENLKDQDPHSQESTGQDLKKGESKGKEHNDHGVENKEDEAESEATEGVREDKEEINGEKKDAGKKITDQMEVKAKGESNADNEVEHDSGDPGDDSKDFDNQDPDNGDSGDGNDQDEEELPRNNPTVGSIGITELNAIASIPNYRLNDNSKIDVMACSHEYELSMARNDFSSTSVEASATGGFGGFSATVSAGFAKSSESSSKSTSTSFQKIMVAKYQFPRCDLIFEPEDLEPTEDFQAAVENIRLRKNIDDLRRLHSTYGQFFCGKVTLGGRLLSTKVMTDSKTENEASQKQDFKVSVGVAVSTPFGGGGVKAEHSKGSSTANSETTVDKNEQQVFEAVGGDTILANNPALWAPTVGDFRNWRPIDRDELVPIIDLLSKMPGYHDIKTLFLRAVPALNSFMTLDSNHETVVRLKLKSPLNGLHSLDRDQVIYFLGHRPGHVARPIVNNRSLMNPWFQTAGERNHIMFKPAEYRAPALLGYLDNKVGAMKYGASYNKDFLEAQWSITAPFTKALQHNTCVVLQTRPYSEPQNTTSNPSESKNPAPTPTVPVAHMIVFRNQQGVFLPAMSDSDEVQYWRLLKADPNARPGEHIQDGEDIRLCWRFDDQTTGYRDFKDDVFGRRTNTIPLDVPELDPTLYLKLPFPRFEPVESNDSEPPPHHMMMAPIASTKEEYHEVRRLKLLGKQEETFQYFAQDVVFRIDKVGNGGYGDSEDYLLSGLKQDQNIEVKDIQVSGKFSPKNMEALSSLFWLVRE